MFPLQKGSLVGYRLVSRQLPLFKWTVSSWNWFSWFIHLFLERTFGNMVQLFITFLSLNQQCPCLFFICHWTPDGRNVASFTLARWHQLL